MSFICYRMTHDSGFAPNPFFNALTLATCKPAIRRSKIKDDWVAGFVSRALVKNSINAGVTVPYQGLVYLMKIGEVITLDAYFKDMRFKNKQPVKDHPDPIGRSGDNIYYMVGDRYCQHPNNSHDDGLETINHDTSGINVLIADMNESYYFGRSCPIPDGGWEGIGVDFSSGRTFYRTNADLENIRDFLRKIGHAPGVHGKPCLWGMLEDATIHCGDCSK